MSSSEKNQGGGPRSQKGRHRYVRSCQGERQAERAVSINDYYKESLFRPSKISKIRSSVNVHLCEDTEWRSVVTYQKDREGHKQRWEVPGVGSSISAERCLVVGNQDEAQARRSIYVMRKLIV